MSGNPDLVGNYVDEQGNIIDDSGARLIGNIFKGPETTTPTFGGKKTKGYKGGKRGGKKGKGKAWKMGKSSKSAMPTSPPTRKKLFPLFPNLTKKPASPPTKLFPFIFPSVAQPVPVMPVRSKSSKSKTPTSLPTRKKIFPIFFPN